MVCMEVMAISSGGNVRIQVLVLLMQSLITDDGL
jgi:hypothetical protein